MSTKASRALTVLTSCFAVAALTSLVGCASSNSRMDDGMSHDESGMSHVSPMQSGRMQSGQAMFDDMLQAHGGKQRWESYRGYAFRTNNLPLGGKTRTDKNIVNLKTRQIRVNGDGYTLGIDQQGRTWIAPGRDALKVPANFYVALPFYFNAMPFVFSDPAADVQATGTKQFHGTTYDTLRVTYADHAGDSPHDAYTLYIDPQSDQLKMIHFRVTHPMMMKKTGGKPIHEWLVFNQWQRVGGLLVPEKATFYHSKNGRMGKKIGTYTVTDASFSRQAPRPSLFAKPRRAAVAPSSP